MAAVRRLVRLPVFQAACRVRSGPDKFASVRGFHAVCARRKTSDESNTIDLSLYPPEQVRNFCIIAHVDHGKSTIADRLLEISGTIKASASNKQVLDRLEVERERGVTVRAHTASLVYEHKGRSYLLNLIDTPGHVDFNYEVRCSLAACQGTLLVVDVGQGVQAQTVANFYLAFERGMHIIPVLNKIDLAAEQIANTKQQVQTLFDLPERDMLLVSAKTGVGMDSILPAIIDRVPHPQGDPKKPFRALLFDSWFDMYKGVVLLVEVIDGSLTCGAKIQSAHTGFSYDVLEVGVVRPDTVPTQLLGTGHVGYIVTGMRNPEHARVGDTLFAKGAAVDVLPGFKAAKCMVFAGIFPVDPADYEQLATSLDKLMLDDSSVSIRKDTSAALGSGWRLGFLGMLHMDVFSQRLEQEYGIPVIMTSPSVSYKVRVRNSDEELIVENPAAFPEMPQILQTFEPMVQGTLVFPDEYLGKVIQLCQEKRGQQLELTYVDQSRVLLKYKLPLSEIVETFFDEIKSKSSGYASFDYEDAGFEQANIVHVQVLLNNEPVDALGMLCHVDRAYQRGKMLCERLRDVIPRQLYEVAIQATSKGKVIARETVKAMRKDVTAKCYGGDISRKMKLLDKQKAGKKRMRSVGNIELPKEAFLSVLKK